MTVFSSQASSESPPAPCPAGPGAAQRMEFTPLGAEFEAVIAAVLLFLLGGLVCFLACFAVTHCYLCYKRRVLRRRRKLRGVSEEEEEEGDLEQSFPSSGDFSSSGGGAQVAPEPVVLALGGRRPKHHLQQHQQLHQKPSLGSQDSSHSSGSTKSTNAT